MENEDAFENPGSSRGEEGSRIGGLSVPEAFGCPHSKEMESMADRLEIHWWNVLKRAANNPRGSFPQTDKWHLAPIQCTIIVVRARALSFLLSFSPTFSPPVQELKKLEETSRDRGREIQILKSKLSKRNYKPFNDHIDVSDILRNEIKTKS